MTLLEPISRRGLLLGSLLAAFPMSPGIGAQDPRMLIDEFWTRAVPLMDSSISAAQRLDGVRSLLQSFFDVMPITEFVLDRFRRVATPQQIQEFFSLYQEYTVRTYSRQLGQLGGAQLVLQNTQSHGAETVVNSSVITSSGGSYRVDWYAVDRGGACKISDLVVEGISMKMTHRNEVTRWVEINGGGFSSVLAVLRQQIGSI